jgi:hypothetical protein
MVNVDSAPLAAAEFGGIVSMVDVDSAPLAAA